MKKIWWCGWEVPFDVPLENMVEKWPEGMKGWRSGEGEDYQTYVGLIAADTDEDAWLIVTSCYGKSEGQIRERFLNEVVKGEAISNRFVGAEEFRQKLLRSIG